MRGEGDGHPTVCRRIKAVLKGDVNFIEKQVDGMAASLPVLTLELRWPLQGEEEP